MTGLQLALLAGALVGLGLALGVWRLIPAQPDPRAAAARRSVTRRPPTTAIAATDLDVVDRLGLWAARRAPAAVWSPTPIKELALLQIPVHRHYGKKIVYALVGLAGPALVSAVFIIPLAAMHKTVPFYIPVVVSIILAGLLFFAPDMDRRVDARAARLEFTRALSAYIDLVALARLGGAQPRQAMQEAASVADSWVFRRIDEELRQSTFSGQAPWDALRNLAEDLGLPALDELADIMRLSGEETARTYTTLRARAAALRSEMLSDELTKANETSERMTIPMSLLGLIFMVMLITPALLRVLLGA